MGSIHIAVTTEKEDKAVSLIKERYPHIKSTRAAVSAALFDLAFDEKPVTEVGVDKEWVTVEEAAKILTENSEDHHEITPAHAYRIARANLITTKKIPGKGRGGLQTRFKAADCHNYHVKTNKSYNFPYKGKQEAVTES